MQFQMILCSVILDYFFFMLEIVPYLHDWLGYDQIQKTECED